MLLHVGCGADLKADAINLDRTPYKGAICADVMAIPFRDDTFDALEANHLIEHLDDPLGFMTELWRVARDGAALVLRMPHGASDDAWEDPTHVRAYFPGSFGYFGQPHYWKADYGYRADWAVEGIHLTLREDIRNVSSEILRHQRNIVQEMIVVLRAHKPARPAAQELYVAPTVTVS
jgi:SAM-dependent methyltransferase